jgi:hypothetical protein
MSAPAVTDGNSATTGGGISHKKAMGYLAQKGD